MIARMSMLALALSVAGGTALAEDAVKIRGTVVSLDGATLDVKDGAGRDAVVALPEALKVLAVVPARLADVTPGSYIGAAAEPGPDGGLVAKEVHIFPESMRGAGEGFRAFDLGPKSSMTNGTVGNEVKGASGDTLTVAYKGGEKSIAVPPGAPVVAFAPGDRAMLTPGAHVIVQADRAAGGALTATRLSVGEAGLVPPM